MKVAHVVGDLEDVHEETEEAKQQQTSCKQSTIEKVKTPGSVSAARELLGSHPSATRVPRSCL